MEFDKKNVVLNEDISAPCEIDPLAHLSTEPDTFLLVFNAYHLPAVSQIQYPHSKDFFVQLVIQLAWHTPIRFIHIIIPSKCREVKRKP